MDSSQQLKHRITDQQAQKDYDNTNNNKKQKKKAMAKRGLRSLAIALSIPICLTLANISLFGGAHAYRTLSKPFWFPPLWLLHLMCFGFSGLMGLSAWLFWAEGGFHRRPAVLGIYLGQLALSLAWNPILFGLGASVVGLLVCLGLLGCVAACHQAFREANPIAGDIVKPCLVWVGFLTLLNLKLLYL